METSVRNGEPRCPGDQFRKGKRGREDQPWHTYEILAVRGGGRLHPSYTQSAQSWRLAWPAKPRLARQRSRLPKAGSWTIWRRTQSNDPSPFSNCFIRPQATAPRSSYPQSPRAHRHPPDPTDTNYSQWGESHPDLSGRVRELRITGRNGAGDGGPAPSADRLEPAPRPSDRARQSD